MGLSFRVDATYDFVDKAAIGARVSEVDAAARQQRATDRPPLRWS